MEGKQITKFFDNKGYHKMLQREKHLQVNVKIQHNTSESKNNVKCYYTLIFFISLSKKYPIIFRYHDLIIISIFHILISTHLPNKFNKFQNKRNVDRLKCGAKNV